MPPESTSQNTPAPIGATDQLEQAAAEIARKKSRSQVTDDDRREAYEQLRKTAPPARSSPPAPDQD